MNTCTRAQITTHEELITIVTRFDSLSGLFWCLFACLTEAKRKLKHRRRKSQLYGIQFLKIRCNGLCSRRGNAESLTIGNSSIRLNQEKLLCTSVTLLYTSQCTYEAVCETPREICVFDWRSLPLHGDQEFVYQISRIKDKLTTPLEQTVLICLTFVCCFVLMTKSIW